MRNKNLTSNPDSYWDKCQKNPKRKWLQSTFVALAVLLSIPTFVEAKINSDSIQFRKVYFQISYGNQCVGFPYQNLFNAFNPSISAGIEYRYNKNYKHSLIQTARFNFNGNQSIGNSFAFITEFRYRYTHKTAFFADASIGLGFLNQYHPRDIYKLNTETGEYDKVQDKGKGGNVVGYGISMGYDFSKRTKYPLAVFVRNNFWIQTPYFETTMFPIIPQSITQIGLTYKFKRNEK